MRVAVPTAAGFLLGSRQTLLETFDGGKTWEPRTVQAAQVPRGQRLCVLPLSLCSACFAGLAWRGAHLGAAHRAHGAAALAV